MLSPRGTARAPHECRSPAPACAACRRSTAPADVGRIGSQANRSPRGPEARAHTVSVIRTAAEPCRAIPRHCVCAGAVGNRNFEDVSSKKAAQNYLAFRRCVAYALAGRDRSRSAVGAAGNGKDGSPSICARVPSARSRRVIGASVKSADVHKSTGGVTATSAGRGLPVPAGDRFAWEPDSTYIRRRRTSTACRARRPGDRHSWGARAVPLGRQHHHRSHLARRLHPQDQPAGST